MNPQDLVSVPFELASNHEDVIRGDVRYYQGQKKKPVLVIAHGFKTFKDWGPFPYIGERFAETGFISVVFNFSHNGVGPNLRRITEFKRFAANTPSKEVQDLGRVIDALFEGSIPSGPASTESIGVVGHSRGAGISIIRARKDSRVGAVAAWSAISKFNRWSRRQEAEWRRRGYLSLVGTSVRPKFRMGVEFLEDLEKNRDSLDILKAASELQVPLLLVYGKQDVVTPVEEAEDLYSKSDRTKTEFVLLEKTGHMLGGGSSPFRGSSTLDHVIDLTSAWFHRYLDT